MNPYRCAIVGCGGIAQVHAAVLNSLPEAKLVACADIKPERAQSLGKAYGAAAYSSLQAMLEEQKPEVLHICTPHYLHTPMARLAAQKGIAVFTEKPPAMVAEQWEEFSAIEGVPIGICFQNRYNRAVQYIKALLETGQAGDVLGARAFVTWCREPRYYTESGWRGSLTTEGGGALINQSIHTLDLLVYLLGKPVACEASCHNRHLKGIIEVEDTLEAYVDFGRAKALFYATTAYTKDSPVLLEIHCRDMTIRMEGEHITLWHTDETKEEIHFTSPEPLGKAYWGNGHHSCIGDFYRCLKENKPPFIGVPQVNDTMELMFSIYKSARG